MPVMISGPFRIEQNDVILFSDFESSGKMWVGVGARTVVLNQVFRVPFKHPPAVHCGLSMWDIDVAHNGRVDIVAENITTESFDIVFRTWSDTRIARARANWMAIGETVNDDGWELY